jgi:hypothetical protein
VRVTPGLDVIAAYSFRALRPSSADATWFHAFDLPRAHASLAGEAGPARGRVLVEAVRSASEGALTGVAGNSLVLRLREAYAGFRARPWLTVDLGLVPTLTVPVLDGAFGQRALGPLTLEATGLASPADLGATARLELPGGYGTFAAGAYNGEGYANQELNRGKNVELAAEIRPAPRSLGELSAFASYVVGSSGAGRVRTDRLTGAVLLRHDRVRGGLTATYAWGVDDAGSRRAVTGELDARVEPWGDLLLAGRASVWLRAASVSDDRVLGVTGAIGYRLARPLEAFVAVMRSLPDEAALAALPTTSFWDLRLVSRLVL